MVCICSFTYGSKHRPLHWGAFCWMPSSSDFSIHFSACDPCTLFFFIACPPSSAVCSLHCFFALCPFLSIGGQDGLFKFGPSPRIPFLGACSACLCREPGFSYISSHEKIPPLPICLPPFPPWKHQPPRIPDLPG